jgi:hypothetical protein
MAMIELLRLNILPAVGTSSWKRFRGMNILTYTTSRQRRISLAAGSGHGMKIPPVAHV